MSNLIIKSRRNAYSIIGDEVTASSARDAATQAGLDWHVSLADVQALAVSDTGVSQLEVPNTFATVRTNNDNTQSVLGTVGGRYKVFQNAEMFSALDLLVDSGDARYAYAGEVKGGAQVYMVLELPRGVKIGNDEHAAYLVVEVVAQPIKINRKLLLFAEAVFCIQIESTIFRVRLAVAVGLNG